MACRPLPPRFVALTAAAITLALGAGCGSGGGAASNGPTTGQPSPTTVAPDAVDPTTQTTGAPSRATTTVPPGDVSALLADYEDGYQFSLTVTVAGSVASTISGRHIGSNTALAASTNGATVEQVITTDGAWARASGQDWVPVEISATTADPLTLLATPLSTIVNPDGSIDASYAAEGFGLPPGELVAHLSVSGNRVTQARYETTVAGKPAVVVSDFAPASDLSAIVAPM
jgi:hypothetical protein